MNTVTIFNKSTDLAGYHVTREDAIAEMKAGEKIEAFAGGLQLAAGFNEYLKLLPELGLKRAGHPVLFVDVDQ